MEPIEEVIENEIEQKSIERTIIEEPEPEPETETELPKRKTKKERSPAQIAAFEKARLKRMEIANQKKQIKAKQKEEDNILKEQIKAKLDNETKPVDIPKPTLKKEVVKPRFTEQPTPREIVREQVVNNYYYYGEQPKKRGRKKKIVEPESESESESEEEYIQQPSRPPSPIQQPETYKELQSYKEEAPKKQFVRAQPKLKFSFV
jgi:phage protein D